MSEIKKIKLRFNYCGETFETRPSIDGSEEGKVLKDVIIKHQENKNESFVIRDYFGNKRSFTPEVLKQSLITIVHVLDVDAILVPFI